jgi:hypothetical protein
MKTKPVVLVVTCDKTWKDLPRFCFNQHFLDNRDAFDLAVVFNGTDSEGIRHVEALAHPEYLLQRPNLGLDLAGFDYGIKNTPRYETYLFMHDDHWFVDSTWPGLFKTLDDDTSIDALGNIVSSKTFPPPHHKMIANALGYEKYQLDQFPYFLQGLAGFYKRRAVDCMLERGGIPHLLDNHRETTFVFERIHSFILLDSGIKFGQIPPGYEKYLKHRLG